jgi:hypothetical protein
MARPNEIPSEKRRTKRKLALRASRTLVQLQIRALPLRMAAPIAQGRTGMPACELGERDGEMDPLALPITRSACDFQ